MAHGRAAAVRPGGGARIPSVRPARARLITGAGALASLSAAGGYAAANGGRFTGVAATGAVLGCGLLFAGLVVRWPTTIPWAVLLTGAAYLVGREGKGLVDGWASVVGALLLLSAELASWSIEHDGRIRSQPSLVVRRAATLAALVAAALFVDFVLLATAAVSASAGLLLAAAGVASAVLAVAVVLRLVRT